VPKQLVALDEARPIMLLALQASAGATAHGGQKYGKAMAPRIKAPRPTVLKLKWSTHQGFIEPPGGEAKRRELDETLKNRLVHQCCPIIPLDECNGGA